jgi:DNA-binding GntR family transcriptional regulator
MAMIETPVDDDQIRACASEQTARGAYLNVSAIAQKLRVGRARVRQALYGANY